MVGQDDRSYQNRYKDDRPSYQGRYKDDPPSYQDRYKDRPSYEDRFRDHPTYEDRFKDDRNYQDRIRWRQQQRERERGLNPDGARYQATRPSTMSDRGRGTFPGSGGVGARKGGRGAGAAGKGIGKGASAGQSFDGQWMSADEGEHMATIRGLKMYWTDGPVEQFRRTSRNSFACEVFGQTLSAKIDFSGKLKWSDGDVWVRGGDGDGDSDPSRDRDLALAAKDRGNVDFKASRFHEAIDHFSEAIELDPTDHVFFSNRSACYASIAQYNEALQDSTECVRLRPDWPKGYSRKGLAEFCLEMYQEAAETYKAGLKFAPNDTTLKEGLRQACDAMYDIPGSKVSEPPPPPRREELCCRCRCALPYTAPTMSDGKKYCEPCWREMHRPRTPSPPKPRPEVFEAPPPDLRTPQQKEADDFKQQGNELYKTKDFERALEMYRKAIEKEPNDITYYNNMCAVWVEMGEEYFDKVLETCSDLLVRRYEINSINPDGASFAKVAKVYARMAVVYEKRKQYDEAIEYYRKALTEDNSRSVRNSLREVERAKEKWQKDSYIDPEKAEEHRERGNELFKQEDWHGAKLEYDEALKRNPSDARLYSNRAAALTKLSAHPQALRDLDECIKLDPTFVKAYSRKACTHFYMKEYHRALHSYEKGLQIQPDNEECKKGREQTLSKIQQVNSTREVDEEQMQHSMADPEIQQLLNDPQIDMLLRNLEENPPLAEDMISKDARLKDAVDKLTAAGILRNG